MAATDRVILRPGALEILHMDAPSRVTINEAVELAERYVAKQVLQVTSGILDRVLYDL